MNGQPGREHEWVHLVVLATLVVALGAGGLFAQTKFDRHQNIQPVFEGWERRADGSFNLVFGYLNRNYEERLSIPIGADNAFSPGEPDRGQPAFFGSPDIKVGLSPCRSDQESCDLGRKRLIHGFFWDLSLSSVSLPLSTAAYAGPALAGGPARRLPRVDVKCSIYGCYSMTDGLETPRKLCRFAELRPTLMSGDSLFLHTPPELRLQSAGAGRFR